MNAALLQCFVKIGLFQHANAPAAVAAAGAGYRCSLFKYDAERFADGGAAWAQAVLVSALGVHPAARTLRALRLGHGDGQAGVSSRPVRQRRPLRGQSSFVLTLETMKISGRSTDLTASSAAFASSSVCKQRHVRFEALADALVGAGSLQRAVDVRADAQRSLPDGHFGIRAARSPHTASTSGSAARCGRRRRRGAASGARSRRK